MIILFIKTENKIIGINDNSRIYLKNYEFETGYKYPEYGDGVILMCNGEEIKAYKKIIKDLLKFKFEVVLWKKDK